MLDTDGYALLPGLVSADACARLVADYPNEALYRSRIAMERHNFGRGEYKYFAYPLPPLIEQLRTTLYAELAPIANRWNELLGIATRFPADHAAFIARRHEAGQLRPTPLVLAYGPGDYNCLHQDLYGEHVFPLQVVVLLSDAFTGGELVITEQRPRMQSRVEVIPLRRGDGAIIPVHHRPIAGTRGYYRGILRHGVSRIRSGARHTLGVIFHDAV